MFQEGDLDGALRVSGEFQSLQSTIPEGVEEEYRHFDEISKLHDAYRKPFELEKTPVSYTHNIDSVCTIYFGKPVIRGEFNVVINRFSKTNRNRIRGTKHGKH